MNWDDLVPLLWRGVGVRYQKWIEIKPLQKEISFKRALTLCFKERG